MGTGDRWGEASALPAWRTAPAAVVPPPPPKPEPAAAAAAPEPEAAAPAPEPEPEEAAAPPAPEPEHEGSVLSGDPELAAADSLSPAVDAAARAAVTATEAAAAARAAVAATEAASGISGHEPEGAVLSGEPEPEPEAEAAPPPEAAPPSAEAPPAPAQATLPLAAPEEARAGGERRALEPSLPASAEQPGRDLGTEILLHIMGLGDRRFVEPGWAGHPGSRRQIEAISIRPREELEPSAIEFRVFAQEGRATAWVSSGNYAGTRGRQLPLTGFAVRPAPELRDRFDIVYEGCFFDGGVIGPKRNGEICTSPVANDPLEAVRISIVERPDNAAA